MWKIPHFMGDAPSKSIREPPMRSFDKAVLEVPLWPHIQLPVSREKITANVDGSESGEKGAVYSSFGATWNIRNRNEGLTSTEKGEDPLFIQVPKYAIVVVDGLCSHSSGYISGKVRNVYGETVIQALSTKMAQKIYEHATDPDAIKHCLEGRLPRDEVEIQSWLAALERQAFHFEHSPFHVLGVYCESDIGSDQAEAFAELLSKHHQPMLKYNRYNPARRNLFEMNETLKHSGIAVVRQCLCTSFHQAEEFCREELHLVEAVERSNTKIDSPCCVVRSTSASGSHTVPHCLSIQEVRQYFESNTEGKDLVVQEMATGVEHVVDLVSHDGNHKVAAVWRCDKRRIYTSPFSIYATHLAHAGNNTEAMMACDYAKAALNALGVNWGLSHLTVMVDRKTGGNSKINIDPKLCCKLIDLKCRQHNIDSTVMNAECIGYTPLDMLLVSYLGDIPGLVPRQKNYTLLEWDDLPDYPATENIRGYGSVIHLVSGVKGSILEGSHRTDIIEIPSVKMVCVNNFGDPRSAQSSVNARDDAGCIYMVHEDPLQFERDYLRVIQSLPDFITVK